MFPDVLFFPPLFNSELDSNTLFTETKVYKAESNTWTKKCAYNTSIWDIRQYFFIKYQQGVWQTNGKNI